ncbi:hypothetical protein BS78_05G224300 [Paspalum vaginatum]|nr:hypothetical protein BS78_05G224300 [Paspalum vaginatum]
MAPARGAGAGVAMPSGVMAVWRAVWIFRRSHACRTHAPAPMPPPRPHPRQPRPLLSSEARPLPWLAGRPIHLRRPLCRPGAVACPNLCGAAVALFEQQHAQWPHTSIRIAAHGRRGEATAIRIYNSVNLRGSNSNGDVDLSCCPPRRATTRTRWLCASEEPAPVLPPSLSRCRRSPSLASQRLRPLHQSSTSVLLTAAPRRRNKPVNSPRWQRSGRAPAPHCSGTATRGARVTTLLIGGPGTKEQAASAQGGSGGSSGGLAPGAAAASRVVVTAWRDGGFSKADRRGAAEKKASCLVLVASVLWFCSAQIHGDWNGGAPKLAENAFKF